MIAGSGTEAVSEGDDVGIIWPSGIEVVSGSTIAEVSAVDGGSGTGAVFEGDDVGIISLFGIEVVSGRGVGSGLEPVFETVESSGRCVASIVMEVSGKEVVSNTGGVDVLHTKLDVISKHLCTYPRCEIEKVVSSHAAGAGADKLLEHFNWRTSKLCQPHVLILKHQVAVTGSQSYRSGLELQASGKQKVVLPGTKELVIADLSALKVVTHSLVCHSTCITE